MEEQNLPLRLSRRAFLCAAATTVGTIAFGSLITACGSQAPGAPEATAAPSAPEATAAPGAPEPTAAPGAPEATAAPEPTAAPAVPAEQ
jgi:hypothetical protein